MALTVVMLVVLGVAAAAVVSSALSTGNYGYERDPTYWRNVAVDELEYSLKLDNKGVAKNVIMFLGDGMGPTTVTAARILGGQRKAMKGEEYKLSFDHFRHTGLSRTYNVDTQTTDSAASGTAYLTGVKTNQGMLGLTAAATRGNCASSNGAEVDSILRWSLAEGKSVGVVSTARITHASPAAAYSHSVERNWESDRLIPATDSACEDIALQLISRNKDIQVIMGGGRAYFLPEDVADPEPDPEFNKTEVSRTDGRNLIAEWQDYMVTNGKNHQYVYNKAGLDSVDLSETDYLLGLFTQSHMNYEQDRDPAKEPSLAEMTQAAITILKRNSKGFFLFVEGGRIDHGHHASQASHALHETLAMAEAVDIATKMTDDSDTLTVVTADHSHVFSVAGYAARGNPILGLSTDNTKLTLQMANDSMPYTTLLYGNGPGYQSPRENLTEVDTQDKNYVFPSALPLMAETHGGEDVAIYAQGPQSFLYSGVHQQNYIPMVMAYASCVGPFAEGGKPCARQQQQQQIRPSSNIPTVNCIVRNNSVPHTQASFSLLLSTFSVILVWMKAL